MEITVSEAARQLGVSSQRVRARIADGSLPARRASSTWLVDSDDVARLQEWARQGGRPASPARGWALLDLLGGGPASAVKPDVRSKLRSRLVKLAGAKAAGWRRELDGRSDVVRVRSLPSAQDRLVADGAVLAGPAEAIRVGLDLVAVDPMPELYVLADRWPDLKRRYLLREGGPDVNMVVRLPRQTWPFDEAGASAVILAADLLESDEPRAVAAGLAKLNATARAVLEGRER